MRIRLFQQVGRTAQRHHHLGETLGSRTVVQASLQLGARFGFIGRQLAQHQHLGAQRHRHFVQACRARFTGQVIHRAAYFQRVAGVWRQRFVHVGQNGRRRHAGAVADLDDAVRQLHRFIVGRHEGAAADLDVHDQRVQASRQFLRQDGAGNHGDRFHGRGHVAHAVEDLVRRRQRGSLADDGHADFLDHFTEQFIARHRGVARDGVELVERAAGVPQAAARDHRYEAAAGSDHRTEQQRHYVAHAAGGMLVEHRARQVERAPVQHFTGIAHRQRKRHALVHAHVVEVDRHRQRGDLAFGDPTGSNAANEELDLLRA